ncbi:MAG: hypothetical protein M3P91_13370, partial [Actinomycetota bacterium]|nr:hypothetical protein [Actinomycetota bacterium]
RQLAAAWELTERSGAGLADLVSTLGDSLRAAERLRRESAAAMAGPTTTAWLLAALPALGVAMGIAMGADPVMALAHPLGAAAVAIGVVLDALGLLWVRRLLATSRNAG